MEMPGMKWHFFQKMWPRNIVFANNKIQYKWSGLKR